MRWGAGHDGAVARVDASLRGRARTARAQAGLGADRLELNDALLWPHLYGSRNRADPHVDRAVPAAHSRPACPETSASGSLAPPRRQAQGHELPGGVAAHAGGRTDYAAAAEECEARALSGIADIDCWCSNPRRAGAWISTLSRRSGRPQGDSLLWNAYIQRHHYLGHQLIPGAQLRYFVRAAGRQSPCYPSGRAPGRSTARCIHRLDRARGAQAAPHRQQRSLPDPPLDQLSQPRLARPRPDHPAPAHDWHACYSYRPVLIETFVEKPRFTGTCYKAANWLYLGDTQGRGKLDTCIARQPIKASGSIPSRVTSDNSFPTHRT